MLTLSETAFYPTSGGQPHDTGTIAGFDVVDVYETDGGIVHVMDEAIECRNDVDCKVNWTRRHDHMQQHTGQHILSQALIQLCNVPTVGFAMGADWSTIVLSRKPDRESLHSVLELANAVVDEDRAIDVLYPANEELASLPIRGDIPEKESVRIVRVAGFDWSPCGGTHCKSTGDVRLIQVLGIRKEKDTYRLEFVCGRRAERISQQYTEAVNELATLLDVGANELVERTRALVEKSRVQEKTINEMREARLTWDCERILGEAKDGSDGVINVILDGRTIQEMRQLGHLLVEAPGTVALLVGKESDKLVITFARSADRGEDMNQVMKRVCEKTGCRGGGNSSFATGGGGADVDADTVLEAAKKALQEVR